MAYLAYGRVGGTFGGGPEAGAGSVPVAPAILKGKPVVIRSQLTPNDFATSAPDNPGYVASLGPVGTRPFEVCGTVIEFELRTAFLNRPISPFGFIGGTIKHLMS